MSNENRTIYLDCDGTWIDLYGVEGWLNDLHSFNARPYREAKSLVNLSHLSRLIHRAQKKSYKVGIISWLSKDSNPKYDEEVTKAKLEWFKKHVPSVTFDEIHIVPYGVPKSSCGKGILIDDEKKNRDEWMRAGGKAVPAENLISFFQNL